MNIKRWNQLNFFEQMANVGSEVERAISWKIKNNAQYSRLSIERALELLSLTIGDKKNNKRLREIVRVYELLADYFYSDNNFQSSDLLWQKYFYNFAYVARKNIL